LHRNNSVTISKRGSVHVDMYDTPLEGSGVDSGLRDEIKKIITE